MNSFNIFDIVLVVLAAVIIFVCGKRGFIKNVIRAARLILSIVAANLLGPKVAGWFVQNVFGSAIYNGVYGTLNGIYQDAAASLNVESAMEAVPAFLRTAEMEAALANATGSGEELVASMAQSIATPITNLVSNIVGYALVFVAAIILLGIAAKILDGVVSALPIVGTLNTVLGIIWGVLVAGIVLLAVSSVIKVFFANDPFYTESVVIRFFGDSAILEAIKIFDVGSALFKDLFAGK